VIGIGTLTFIGIYPNKVTRDVREKARLCRGRSLLNSEFLDISAYLDITACVDPDTDRACAIRATKLSITSVNSLLRAPAAVTQWRDTPD